MNKKKQMENPFFDPDKPGSIFIAVDRYHRFIPLPNNSLRFVEAGLSEKTEGPFRKFLADNVDGVKCCTYIPDMEMARYDLTSMRDVPVPDMHVPFDSYIRQELLPYLQSRYISPYRQISLPDAVYCSRYKGTPDCSILKKYFMQGADYLSFRINQNERQKIYRGEANYRTPLKVVENDYGYLIFSGNEIGKEGFRECIQHIADHYFDPHYNIGHLGIYEYPYITEELVAHIDASYRIDHARQLNNAFEFRRENYIAPSELPDKFISGLTPLYYSPMETTADGFMELLNKLHFDSEARMQFSNTNRDIYRLLTVIKNGYMNIHEQPFTYFNELLPVAEKLEKITQVKSIEEFNHENFKQAALEIRKAADKILKRDFDVRGHRSLIHMLNDPAVKFMVGSVILDEQQKKILASGYALHIPENSGTLKHLEYCMANFREERIEHSSIPFNLKTYEIRNGTPCLLPLKNSIEETASKKPTIKNKSNINHLK